jgi:hypothetical protein
VLRILAIRESFCWHAFCIMVAYERTLSQVIYAASTRPRTDCPPLPIIFTWNTGGRDGHDLEHWLRAAEELLTEGLARQQEETAAVPRRSKPEFESSRGRPIRPSAPRCGSQRHSSNAALAEDSDCFPSAGPPGSGRSRLSQVSPRGSDNTGPRCALKGGASMLSQKRALQRWSLISLFGPLQLHRFEIVLE